MYSPPPHHGPQGHRVNGLVGLYVVRSLVEAGCVVYFFCKEQMLIFSSFFPSQSHKKKEVIDKSKQQMKRDSQELAEELAAEKGRLMNRSVFWSSAYAPRVRQSVSVGGPVVDYGRCRPAEWRAMPPPGAAPSEAVAAALSQQQRPATVAGGERPMFLKGSASMTRRAVPRYSKPAPVVAEEVHFWRRNLEEQFSTPRSPADRISASGNMM